MWKNTFHQKEGRIRKKVEAKYNNTRGKKNVFHFY